MYKLEMHVHSRPVSRCGHIDPEEEIAIYKAAGYQGMVSTNHINLATFQDMEELSWPEKAAYFMSGYEAQKAVGDEDFDVLLGCEINLSRPGQDYIPNDYLVYGVTEQWLLETGDPRRFTLKQLSQAARGAGLLLVQAHPFRCGTILMEPDLLDGLEVFNGNNTHDSHNALADYWADMNGLIKTSGSDFHKADSSLNAGIRTKTRIRTNQELLQLLRSGDYELIKPEE